MRLRHAAILPALALGFGAPAVAGPYSDDLAKCLVGHASSADHEALVRWMFAALAAGPAVRDMMSDPAVQAEMGSLDKGMDRTALDAINKEAGLPTAPPAK